MSVTHLEILVEEPSAEVLLSELLPKILVDTTFTTHRFACKNDLLSRLPDRLRGYARWIPSDWRIVVLVDRDRDDCVALKAKLDKMAESAGLAPRSRPHAGRFTVINRIAVEELEAWYFGDWEAVRSAYPRVKATVPTQAKYRDPDGIAGGTWEAFERVMKRAGYYATGLPKIEVAHRIGPHMRPNANTSPSFKAFHAALQDMVGLGRLRSESG